MCVCVCWKRKQVVLQLYFLSCLPLFYVIYSIKSLFAALTKKWNITKTDGGSLSLTIIVGSRISLSLDVRQRREICLWSIHLFNAKFCIGKILFWLKFYRHYFSAKCINCRFCISLCNWNQMKCNECLLGNYWLMINDNWPIDVSCLFTSELFQFYSLNNLKLSIFNFACVPYIASNIFDLLKNSVQLSSLCSLCVLFGILYHLFIIDDTLPIIFAFYKCWYIPGNNMEYMEYILLNNFH